MRIVTTTSVFPPSYPIEKAIDRLSAIGYNGLDLAIDYCVDSCEFPFMTEEWSHWGLRLCKKARERGVSFTHAHASGDAGDRDPIFYRGFSLCGIMKIPYIVVHPVFKNQKGAVISCEDEFLEVNTRSILPLLELAEENNVTILSENLLWGASKDPLIIARLVKEVASPFFGWCFDTGHANCFGISPNVLLDTEVTPLSLHIQDNHGFGSDEHLIPGDGNYDWKLFLELLHRINYQGDLVLEAHHQSLECEDEKREEVLNELYLRSEKMLLYYTSLK